MKRGASGVIIEESARLQSVRLVRFILSSELDLEAHNRVLAGLS